MKFRLLFIVVAIASLLWVFSSAVLAQEEPPSPYSGLINPFPWDDTSAQEAGKGIYQRSCQGCHGINGANIATSDFSTTDFRQSLEESPGFYFWKLSEGRLDRGMPPFKSSLSEEQRWQTLTYLWSLGAAASSEVAPAFTQPSPEMVNGSLLLTAPEQAQSGQPLTLTATLKDSQGKAIGNVPVEFLIKTDFFISGSMEIGEALTNNEGIANFEYAPRQTGDVEVVARYQTIETASKLSLTETDEPFYQAEAGIQLPAPGDDVLIGPKSALELGEEGNAPMTVFRLPGGVVSWLLIVAATVMLIWFTYFRVMYQVFRIPIVSEIGETDTRLVPLAGLAMVVILGILLLLMLLTGPYSHWHLLR